IEDIDEIAEYIARDSRVRAARFVSRLYTAVSRLQDFPYSGRTVPESNKSTIREIFVYPYRVIYRVTPDEVIVWTVVHMRRDFKPHDPE
ncbi:MAG TPA: type II toxin-antitoxin system RelE/ParE family toxin, partial [Longimicrobiaceae bacterium]|nr:type II toxin-antitoxin system RelE/ParE family toxin [Longimicrobiaceae bacterium]